MPRGPNVTRAIEDRRMQVSQLRLAGIRDQRTIAARLGVDRSTISRDFAALDILYRERAAQDIATAKGQDLERIEDLITALWPEARKGRWLAVDRVISLLDRKAKLLGLDAPAKQHVTGQIDLTVFDGALDELERRLDRLSAPGGAAGTAGELTH